VTDSLVSIILPVRNQADHISGIVTEYADELAKLPRLHELILVVNASRDASYERCQDLAHRYASVRCLSSQRGGWGRAVNLGLHEARGELLCYTNSARTNSKDLILLLLYAIAYPNVVVKANRKIRENWGRRFGSLLYNLECRALFDIANWDINGTPKIFPRSFQRLLELTRDDDLIDAEFNVICRQERYPMVEVPIFSTRRHGGQSSTRYSSALKMYWGAYQLWRRMRATRNLDLRGT
jgi:glycosyltransferase involved in cell wall biosynthesis